MLKNLVYCEDHANSCRHDVLQVRSEAQRLKEEAEKRLSRYMKQLDHFERARREEEAPVLQAAYQKKVYSSQI